MWVAFYRRRFSCLARIRKFRFSSSAGCLTFGANMSLIKLSLLWLAILFFAAGTVVVVAADSRFTYFRSEAGLQTGMGPLPDRLDVPQLLKWRVAADSGHSTPVLRSGKIFLTTY